MQMNTFRNTTAGDYPLLAQIIGEVWADDTETRAKLANAFYDDCSGRLREDHAGWTFEFEGRPVALAFACRTSGELLGVGVLPQHRRKGIARELLRQAEAWIYSHGLEEILLALDEFPKTECWRYLEHLGWNLHQGGSGRSLVKKNPGPFFKLEEHLVIAPDMGYSRLVRLMRGPEGTNHKLCIFLDGELYWRDLGVMDILNELLESHSIPPATFAFVGCVSGPARQADFVCNERYARFIGETVIDWISNEVPGVEKKGHAVVGLSLSGLMAVYLKLNFPGRFDSCLSQSGSHWWEHEKFGRMVQRLEPLEGRFWLSVGDQETSTNVRHSASLFQEISQIEGVERLAGLLSEVGGEVHSYRYQGGHSAKCWRDEFGEALTWILSDRPRETKAARGNENFNPFNNHSRCLIPIYSMPW